MRITETVEKMVSVDETKAIMCNKCGEFTDLDHLSTIRNFDIKFGYGEYDNQHIKFDLCDKCLMDFTDSFKIVSETIEEEEWDWDYQIESVSHANMPLKPLKYV